MQKQENQLTLHLNKKEITSAVFSPDGKKILTASRDGTARLWNAENGQQIGISFKHEMELTSAVFSPDGKKVLTTSWDFTARLWNAETGEPIGIPMKHDYYVNIGVFSPD